MSEIEKPERGQQPDPAEPVPAHPAAVTPRSTGATSEPAAPAGPTLPAAPPADSAYNPWQAPQPAAPQPVSQPSVPTSSVPMSAAPLPSAPSSSPLQPGGYQTYPGHSPYAALGQDQYGQAAPAPWTPPGSQGRGNHTVAKVVAGAAAAVVLSLCSGLVGAVAATQFVDDAKPSVISSNSTATAPVIDRKSLAGVAVAVEPSVVNISTGSGEGSGVVLTANGFILTNNHVVANATGKAVTVTLANGRRIKATIVGTDPKTDLGVVKADTSGLTPAVFGNSDATAVGDTVLAIGSPLGLQGSVTAGIVSAKGRTISVGGNGGSLSGLLQTDAPINPGNSGGALVNTAGEVVGINSAIATNGGGEGNIGVGFAIPSNKAKQIAEQIMNGKPVSHPFLGVQVTAAEAGGAQVSAVTANSPAEKAGLQKNDIITKFGEQVVNNSEDLVSAVQSGTVGQQVSVEYSRNGASKTATVTLGEAS